MKRSFKSYYKEAFLASKKAFKKKDNLIKYYSYFIPSLIFRLVLFILYPLFRAQDHRMGRLVRNNEDLDIGKIYSKGDDFKNIHTSLHLYLMLILNLIGRIIALLIPAALYVYFIGLIFTYYIRVDNVIFYPVVYGPAIIMLIIVLIISIKYLIEALVTPYLLEATDDKASTIYNKSKELGERGGFWYIFLNLIITTLLQILIIGGFVGISFAIKLLSAVIIDEVIYPLFYITSLTLSLLALKISPVFTLTRRVFNELVFEDLYISNTRYDNIKTDKKLKKVFDSKVSNQDINKDLLKLFDEQVELNKFIEPKPKDEEKEIEVLKNKEETNDFFDDSQITNEESSIEDFKKVQKNQYQEIVESDENHTDISQDTLSSIDDLLKEKVDENIDNNESFDNQVVKEDETNDTTNDDNQNTDLNESLDDKNEEKKENE